MEIITKRASKRTQQEVLEVLLRATDASHLCRLNPKRQQDEECRKRLHDIINKRCSS